MYEIPAFVRRHRYVRRGGVDVPPFEVDAASIERVGELFAGRHAFVVTVLDDPQTSEALRSAGNDWLDGKPDASPAGAAAASAAAGLPPGQHAEVAGLADLWIARRGLVFAAIAAVEFALAEVRSPRIDSGYLHRVLPDDGRHTGFCLPMLWRIRAALAVAPDQEYAEIVTALRKYRHSHLWGRAAASVLLPGEGMWVEEDIVAALRAHDTTMQYALVTAASTPWQATRLAAGAVGLHWLTTTPGPLATLVDGVGPDVVDALFHWFDGTGEPDAQRLLLPMLAEIDSDAAFADLLARLNVKYVVGAVLDAANRFPARGVRLLAEAGSGAHPIVGELLRAHLHDHPSLTLPQLSEPAAARVRGILAAAGGDQVGPGELPEILAAPPWQRKGKAAAIVVDGLACTDPPGVRWLPGEREQWLAMRGDWPAAPGSWTEFAAEVTEKPDLRRTPLLFAAGPDEIVRPLLTTWRPEGSDHLHGWIRIAAARFGVDALPLLLHVAGRSSYHVDVLLPYSSPEVAVLMADRFTRLKSARAAALAWLVRHPVEAARALAPGALGGTGTVRRQAERALLALHGRGYTEAVRVGAGAYGKEALEGVEALLDRNLTALVPARMPVVPDWAQPGLSTRVRLRGDTRMLPAEAVGAVVTMLMLSTMDDPYPGIALARQACEPGDLAELAWQVFHLGELAGDVQGWTLDALALLGDDETARRLAPRIAAWPGDAPKMRAAEGLRVLAAIGSPVALECLEGIVRRPRYPRLKFAAEGTRRRYGSSWRCTRVGAGEPASSGSTSSGIR